jgi:surface protein
MEKVKAKTREELESLIQQEIKQNGCACSLNHIDVSEVTDMACLFQESQSDVDLSKFDGDISQWDVSNVEDMAWMFDCSRFNGDISQWDVSSVTMMQGMFLSSAFNGDISQWDVSKVEDMDGVFSNAQFNGDISKWNVSNVQGVRLMFNDSRFNGDLRPWGWPENKMKEAFAQSFEGYKMQRLRIEGNGLKS